MKIVEWAAIGGMVAVAGIIVSPKLTAAQTQRRGMQPPAGFGGSDQAVGRLMALDANHDGTLTRAEVTDPRLQRLFADADANHDAALTKAELTAFFAKQNVNRPPGGPPFGPGGQGGPGFGPGGPGGPGFGGPPKPGTVLPDFLQERLGLSAAQKKELAKLQADVDSRLHKILTVEQRNQIAEMGRRGPGGPGGPGAPGGFGRPGGFGPPGAGPR